MEVRILGAHNLDSRDAHHTCLLVDGVLAIDAGSLASTLAMDEQKRVRHILLTHLHFDHARDVPTIGLATLDESSAVTVHAEEGTKRSVLAHFLDAEVYPDLSQSLNGEAPSLVFSPVVERETFHVNDYEITPVRMQHAVPTVGYVVGLNEGRRIAHSGDTKGALAGFLRLPEPPDVLLVDVTFPNRLRERAEISMHMTPSMLEEELQFAKAEGLTIPHIVPVHRSLRDEPEILAELAAVERQTGVTLEPGTEDMIVS